MSVEAEHPTVGPFSEEIAADAILAPLAQAAIEPRISAPVAQEFVQRGARVHKGELLLTLEDRDLRGTALDSKGNVPRRRLPILRQLSPPFPKTCRRRSSTLPRPRQILKSRTALPKNESICSIRARSHAAMSIRLWRPRCKRRRPMTPQQSILRTCRRPPRKPTSMQRRDSLRPQGKLDNAQAQVDYASLRSPIDGVVTDRPLFPGETAAAGTPVVTVMDTSSLLAKLHIAQQAAQKLKVGGTAELSIPGVDDAQPATIAVISPALDTGSTTVEIWLKLPNPGGRFKVGTPVRASIRGITVPNAIQLPAGAILPADDGSTNVLVVGGDRTAHKRAVKVGMRTPEAVQILGGITASDLVVTDGGYGLDDGTKVKIGKKDDDKGGDSDQPAGGSKE